MKFKIDENLPLEFASLLQHEGYDASTALDEGLGGASDAELFHQCLNEYRILVTLDLDFANIRNYDPNSSSGIIVFRIQPHDKNTLMTALRMILPLIVTSPLQNCLWIVEHDRIRIRGAAE